ncbi:hypothetical protein [Paraburkholderia sediminicola]|uniref:hypothetical protein n=1 Tax=Paraburkholderia sediminicola TaxID=458836 RepID=UPI0038BB901A
MNEAATRFSDDLIVLKDAHLRASGCVGKLIGAEIPIAIYSIAVRTASHPHGGVPITFAG